MEFTQRRRIYICGCLTRASGKGSVFMMSLHPSQEEKYRDSLMLSFSKREAKERYLRRDLQPSLSKSADRAAAAVFDSQGKG